ncbi:MAG: hypothetical protein FJ206_05260 [Gemmatimonadetes bacterium]|nr:hypothetical protein [Gemmatimonadota bacterium]
MATGIARQLNMVGRVWNLVRSYADGSPARGLLEEFAGRVARLNVLAAALASRGQSLSRAQTAFEHAEREVRVWMLGRPATAIPIHPVPRGRLPTPVVIRTAWSTLAAGRRFGAARARMSEVDLEVLADLLARYDLATRTLLHRRLETVSAEAELTAELDATNELLAALDEAICSRFRSDPGRLMAWAQARRLGPGLGPELPTAA